MNNQITMLVIDDNHSLVCSLAMMLRTYLEERITLTEMTDSVAAKHWIEKHGPHLVLTDLQMPEVDGLEILRSARKRNPYCQVILHSAHISAEVLCLALKLEAADYLLKSESPEHLLQVVEHTCDRIIRWEKALQPKQVIL